MIYAVLQRKGFKVLLQKKPRVCGEMSDLYNSVAIY